MRIESLLHELAEMIRQDPPLSTTPVVVEDVGDVDAKIRAAVGRTSRCVVVGFGGCEPRRQGEDGPLIAKTTLVATVFEKPSVNRRPGQPAATALGMAQRIAARLQGCAAADMASRLFFRRITPIEEQDPGVVSCGVIFDTTDVI